MRNLNTWEHGGYALDITYTDQEVCLLTMPMNTQVGYSISHITCIRFLCVVYMMSYVVDVDDHLALKFDRHLDIRAVEVPVKFRSDRTFLNTFLAASRLHEIVQYDALSIIDHNQDSFTGKYDSTDYFGINSFFRRKITANVGNV